MFFAPGEAFQFDWSEDYVVLGGKSTKLQIAQFKLSNSRAFYLRAYPLQTQEMLWGNDDPLFPATQVGLGDSRQFQAIGLHRVHWSNASRIRTIFREAFTSADLPYFNPHSFRNTLVRLGQSLCRTPEEFKAWSQNLGHDKVLTTFINYGQVESSKQGKIIRELADPQPLMNPDFDGLAKALVREMRETVSKLPGNSN